MYFDQIGAIGRDRLRLLFDGSVVSQDIAGDATYGEVARMFDETTRMRHGNLVAINVTLEGCVSAWKKDPVDGVIGVQSGPP